MSRGLVFVSYCHSDQRYADGLLSYLDFLADRQEVSVWSDVQLVPGDDWCRKIERAIEQSRLAVLLVSQDFLRSEFIQRFELPRLVRAAEKGQLRLACLYLDAAQVDRYPVSVLRPSGEVDQISLSRYQALHDPNDTLEKRSPAHRKELFLEAAEAIERLLSEPVEELGPDGVRPPPGFELAVHLDWRQDDTLVRTYSTRDWPQFESDASPWDVARAAVREAPRAEVAGPRDSERLGDALFEVLFGPTQRRIYERVLHRLCRLPDDRVPSPDRYPVRVLVQTPSPTLASYPWLATSWSGRRLVEDGWTFQVVPSAPRPGWPSLGIVELETPCNVVALMPDPPAGAPGATPHFHCVDSLVQRLWSTDPLARVHRVRRASDIRSVVVGVEPGLVYGVLRTRDGSDGTELLLEGSSGEVQPIGLQTLEGSLRECPPTIVLFLLVDCPPETLAQLGNALLRSTPVVILRVVASDGLVEARRRSIEWLSSVFSAPGIDPLLLLARFGEATTRTFTRYSRFTLRQRGPTRPVTKGRFRLNVDRHTQRAFVAIELKSLLAERQRRVWCAIASGTVHDGVADFSDQVHAYVRDHERRHLRLVRVPLDLPQLGGGGPPDRLAEAVQRQLGLATMSELPEYLLDRVQETDCGTGVRPIVHLDWRTSPITKRADGVALLTDWAEFCRHHLVFPKLTQLRVFSLLALEARARHLEGLDAHVRALRAVLFDAASGFRLRAVPRLGPIPDEELEDILFDRVHVGAPDEIRRQLVELIRVESNGRFREVVDLLEEGASGGWYNLYDRLREIHGSKPEHAVWRG